MPRSGSAAPLGRATSVRWRILLSVSLVIVLTYLDRLNFSIAGQYIQSEFGFDTKTMGWLLSAFLLSYSLMQIPGGWAADRWGARRMIFFAVVWWSFFTAMTGLAPHLGLARWFSVAWSFAIVRFLIGVGEAAGLPATSKIVSAWAGTSRRGVGSSFTILGMGAGGALTPVLIAWIMQRWGWRASFYALGCAGLVGAFLWRWYVTDRPEQHPSVNAAELAKITAGAPAKNPGQQTSRAPWGKILSSGSVWALVFGYLCQGFPIYFFHTWFFIYLVNIRGLSVGKSALFGTIPYVAIVCLAPLGGIFSDFAVARFGLRRGRRLAIGAGMLASAAALWLGSSAHNTLVATLLLAAGAGFNLFAAVTFWAICIDLSPEYAASVSGLMNTAGNFGGWLCPIVTAYIATRYSWTRAIVCVSIVTLGAAVSSLLIRADRQIETQG